MKEKLFSFALVALGLILSAATGNAFKRTVNVSADKLTISYSFEDMTIIEEENGTARFYIPDFGECQEIGKPAILRKAETFLIPPGREISNFHIVSASDTVFDLKCTPAIPPKTASDEEVNISDLCIQPYEGLWPDSFIELGSTGSCRDLDIGTLILTPLKYDYNNSQIHFCQNLTIEIEFLGLSGFTPSHSLSSSYMSNIISIGNLVNIASEVDEINTRALSDEVLPEGYELAPLMLIVTPKELEGAAKKLADWRRRTGLNVAILTPSEAILSDPEALKLLIVDKYNNAKNL